MKINVNRNLICEECDEIIKESDPCLELRVQRWVSGFDQDDVRGFYLCLKCSNLKKYNFVKKVFKKFLSIDGL